MADVMAEERTEEEQEAIATFLREINKDRAESGSSPIGTSTALLFLIARKFNAERAITLYKQYQYERHLYYLQSMEPYDEPLRSELLSGKFTVLNARDHGGAAIALFTAKDHFPAASSHMTVIQGIAFQLDESLKSKETQKSGIVLVYDMTESGYNNFDFGLARKVLALLKGAYPARLKNVFIISPPLWFKAVMSFFANFLQEKLKERLVIIPKELLPERLPESSIPESLGGTLKVDHLAWLNKCLESFSQPLKESDPCNGAMGNSAFINGQIRHRKNESLDSIERGGLSNEGVMSVMEFVEHMIKKTKKGIKDEYTELKRQPVVGGFESAKLPANLRKNRYTDVLCVEHSRVKLSEINGDVTSNYIHANFVDGYKQVKAYIATQGPLPNTKGDFWRLVWEQQVLVVVMVTRCIERSRMKCIQYWPEQQQTEEFETLNVIHQETLQFEDHIERMFYLKHKKTGEARKVVHFQMTSWPDFGVPSSAESCLHVVGLVRQAQRDAVVELGSKWSGHPKGPPILVHCSAGIGRTGTFCTIDVNVARLASIVKCEVYNTVKQLRTQRVLTIQTVEQYEFCHLAILEHVLTMANVGEEEKQTIRDFLQGWKLQLENSSDSD